MTPNTGRELPEPILHLKAFVSGFRGHRPARRRPDYHRDRRPEPLQRHRQHAVGGGERRQQYCGGPEQPRQRHIAGGGREHGRHRRGRAGLN